MKKSDFFFELPQELIAQHPLPERSASRLLKLNRSTGETADLHFTDLVSELKAGDLLVFNNTEVIPARMRGRKISGGQVEVFIERLLNSSQAKVMLKSNKSVKLGTRIFFNDHAHLTVTARQGMFFLAEADDLNELMSVHGDMPLPPYINRAVESADQDRYQTIYAERAGAVAAPTAGLHFDQALLDAIEAKGVQTAFVTLHVGAGTFQPVKTERVEDHAMHKEWLQVDASVVDAIRLTQANGGRVIAVGTTAVRCLETAAQSSGRVEPFVGDTQIFIYPGYDFKVIDGLITNFHLPESTLVMLVSALAGRDAVIHAYQHAVNQRYRFFSYGDAMLII